ncbi:MAG: dTMP kinase [Mycoplasmoidaceae bacterium]
MINKRGKFIVFEGIDGSGKSTILRLLSEKLNQGNYRFEFTEEPSNFNALSSNLRNLLLDEYSDMSYKTEALLFSASRNEHLEKFIIPKLESGINVICDRFLLSSLAFQGYGRKLGTKKILNINNFILEDFEADLTIFFDIPIDISLDRINKNTNRNNNHFDKETIIFKQDVYQGYLDILNSKKYKIISVDATKKIDDLLVDIFNIIQEFIK